MKKLLSVVARFIHDEGGASAVEYGVLVALIAAAIVVIVFAVGQQIKEAFKLICNGLKNVPGVGGACTG